MIFESGAEDGSLPIAEGVVGSGTHELDNDPEDFADDYVGWGGSDRIEWIRFRARFSAAVFAYRAMAEIVTQRVHMLQEEISNHDLHQEWGGEIEDVLYESKGFYEDSARITGAAALVSVTAALELLLVELDPNQSIAEVSRRPAGGFFSKLNQLLISLGCSDLELAAVRQMVVPVLDLRNALAHSLDGSDWASEEEKPDLTPAGMDLGFRNVGKLAEEIIVIVESKAS